MSETFDPNAAAEHDTLYGLPPDPERAELRILPVPFEATCSYGAGTSRGPEAVRLASQQVDLLDPRFGATWKRGIHLDDVPAELAEVAREANALAAALHAASPVPTDEALRTGEAAATDRRAAAEKTEGRATEQGSENVEASSPQEAILRIDELSARRSAIVEEWTRARLAEGRTPGILGGDHSCPLGAMRAIDGAFSVLHIDAHLDLRERFEGFAESHASIYYNVLEQCGEGIEALVQLGIRDYCDAEFAIAESDERVHAFYWNDWSRAMLRGANFAELAEPAIAELGERVWVSFDIDGLDPVLCPKTGTPVPGGLSFDQAAFVLEALKASGREVLGFDVCEVGDGEWDGNVGARVLYMLCAL